ncbi:MAG: S41 family peptidase [Spirochaetota bacterium]|nr:S41 family peptidase [Spirochaetota bacterium]
MKKKIKERRLHLLFLFFLLGFFLGINRSFLSSSGEPAHKYLDYFHQVYQIIKTDFVETPKTEELFYGAIEGIVRSLNDPYSRFLGEEDYYELREETTGKFVGVGIEITVKEGEIVVISPIEDTPAMRAGIQTGDIIVKVDDIQIKNKKLSEIVKMIKGLPHTKVKLFVRREGFAELLEFNIERVPIKIETVNYDILKDLNIGYLKIKVFSSNTPRDVEKALDYFNKKGIERVIIDLRWNPGGLLDKAISISDMFLDKGRIIVSTKGREGVGNINEFKSLNKPLYNGKLVVLVNEGSASASEIFSGAIRDNNRGKLVGEKTFGKGSVQKVFGLDEDIGITLTIAKYYTPSGVSIHGKGLKPDYRISRKNIYEADKENISVIIKEGLTEKFVASNGIYSDENVKRFKDFLDSKGLSISLHSAGFILKREISKYSKRPIYDMEYDNQLKQAIAIINER